jgi:hypothetical protein
VHEVAGGLRAELQRLFDEAQAAVGTPNPPRPDVASVVAGVVGSSEEIRAEPGVD